MLIVWDSHKGAHSLTEETNMTFNRGCWTKTCIDRSLANTTPLSQIREK